MSGIYGIFHKNQAPVTPNDLATIAQCMAFWGPDGHGEWVAGALGLGHLMLHTTPESCQERLPAAHPHIPDFVITADAWLDNRAELFALLGVDRDEQATMPDSTLILLAYEKWGTACAAYLLGDFAFVIWDGVEQRLFCARDPFGCKPFLYYDDGQRFLFASDINGLLAALPNTPALHEPLLAAWLQENTHFAEKRLTFYQGIVKLPPAHTLTVTATQSQLVEYWSPLDAPSVQVNSVDEAVETVCERLHQAVATRLRTPFALGAHLSGGMDSSVVTALAARALRQQDQTLTPFSWSPPPAAKTSEELDQQRVTTLCQHEQITCHYTTLCAADLVALYQRDVTRQPTLMLAHEQIVQQQASAQGIRVLLSGWGGDEGVSFNGRGYLPSLLWRGQWRTLHRLMLQRVQAHAVGVNPLRKVKQYGHYLYTQAITPVWQSQVQPWWDGNIGYGRWKDNCIQPSFAQRQQQAVVALRGPRGGEYPDLRVNQQHLLTHGHLTRRIEDWATAGARHRLVYRYPLLDRRLVEFCLGLPETFFLDQGWSRAFFSKVTGTILPASLQYQRSKAEPALRTRFRTLHQQSLLHLYQQLSTVAPHHPAARYVNFTRLEKVRQRVNPLEFTPWHGFARALVCFYMQPLLSSS